MAGPIALLYFFLALGLPLLIFLELGNNLNERKPWLPFLVCIPLCLLAGLLTTNNKKWIVLAGLIGLAEALALVLLV